MLNSKEIKVRSEEQSNKKTKKKLHIYLLRKKYLLPAVISVQLRKTYKIVFRIQILLNTVAPLGNHSFIVLRAPVQPRSQGFFPGLGAGREKALASAGHVSILHPEILGVIN